MTDERQIPKLIIHALLNAQAVGYQTLPYDVICDRVSEELDITTNRVVQYIEEMIEDDVLQKREGRVALNKGA